MLQGRASPARRLRRRYMDKSENLSLRRPRRILVWSALLVIVAAVAMTPTDPGFDDYVRVSVGFHLMLEWVGLVPESFL